MATLIPKLVSLAAVLIGFAAAAQPGVSPGATGKAPALPITIKGQPYTKLATREATEKRMLEVIFPSKAKWGDWQALAAFPFKKQGELSKRLAPEEELAKMQADGPGPDLAAEYDGKWGKALWKNVGDLTDKTVDLHAFAQKQPAEFCVVYLYVRVDAEEDTSVPVQMGSDDGLRFWLNGKVLVDDDDMRGMDADSLPTKMRLEFKKGANHLLAKVSQGKGGYDFRLNRRPVLDSYSDALLQYHMDVDFPPTAEGKFYRNIPLYVPEEVVLEVGGLDILPDGRPIVSTRRGDVYIIENAYAEPAFDCKFKKFASGLHEPLGLQVRTEKDDKGKGQTVVYCTQRGELTRMIDIDGDDVADRYETACDKWGVSGNYHEFAFGPKFDRNGDAWVTLNVGFCGSLGKSIVPWRGWSVKINTKTGDMTPICGGVRSPNGFGEWTDGTFFYVDNQGDYMGTNRLAPLIPGSWHGHPAGLRWRDGWKEGDPSPEVIPATIWFPYRKMGQSVSDFLLYSALPDSTTPQAIKEGKFGPFRGQAFCGDQTLCMVNRVTIEKIDGVYQGACIPFRWGLQCGVNRLAWGKDGSMFVGQTDRGWGSIGRRRFGVERLVWTGQVPFEVQDIKIARDGFDLTFTQDIDEASASNPASYAMISYTYEYHPDYGSAEMDTKKLKIATARVTGPRAVHLGIEGVRAGGMGYVHELTLPGVKALTAAGTPGEGVLHPNVYYTVQRLPGPKN